MSLQNRVSPLGDIVATPARGTFTGNRGIVHDPTTRTLLKRRWTTKAWIACVCEFRGRRRDVMGTQSWTELFFLDEATAFAAGHRPCFYCRRADATAFRDAWRRGNRTGDVRASDMDVVLHAERLEGRAKRLHPLPVPLAKLPDGTMVRAGNDCFLVADGRPRRWTFEGYCAADARLANPQLITPPSTVRTMMAGYRPVLHVSAELGMPPP